VWQQPSRRRCLHRPGVRPEGHRLHRRARQRRRRQACAAARHRPAGHVRL